MAGRKDEHILYKLGAISAEVSGNEAEEAEMYPIAEIDDATLAFPAMVKHLMPAQTDIPDEFRRSSNKWNKLFNDWFFSGLSSLSLRPKEGVDKDKALRHICTIMRSFQPKHEDKEAAVAFLLNEWFEDEQHKRKVR